METRIGVQILGPAGDLLRISRYLGRGAFGEVYLAESIASLGKFAVKLLPLDEIERPEQRNALLNEARLGLKVEHENVVRIVHVNDGESSGIGPFILMEFVDGGTLATILKSYRDSNVQLPLEQASQMMLQVARGAKAINEHLIHRDIKPDNIL
jgi:serine/threonine protein kinase